MHDGKVVWVTPTACDTISSDESLPTEFGAKAAGLIWPPSAWIPRYFVISPEIHRRLKLLPEAERFDYLQSLKQTLSSALNASEIELGADVLLRSNALRETLTERGKFSSIKSTANEIATDLHRLYKEFDSVSESEAVGVIVQEYISPVLKGHLSNERRVAEEYRDGLILLEDQGGSITEQKISFRRWRSDRLVDKGALLCTSEHELHQVLRAPLAFAAKATKRVHYEWVWDGHFVSIVQADLADERTAGISPENIWTDQARLAVKIVDLNYFSEVTTPHNSAAGKMRNHALYSKHGFWQPTFYSLKNEKVIDKILKGERDPALSSDLERLTVRPLVIRTSSEPSCPLLPRSSLLTTVNDAEEWLYGAFSDAVREKNIRPQAITLLAHHFISAKVAAFSTGAPERVDVYVESLWGIPEGLYYYPFDSHTVHTFGADPDSISESDLQRFESKTKRRYKSHFVAPDSKGQFVCHQLAAPWDWKSTISDKKFLARMAWFTRQLTKLEGFPVSLMWFIHCETPQGPVGLVPWYHEKLSAVQPDRGFRRNARDMILNISTEKDLIALESRPEENNASTGRLVLELSPVEDEAIRSENFARRVGVAAKRLNAVVVLNGASLSHIYYVLVRTGAEIVARNIGDSVQKRQVHEKLVRDKIPDTVAAAGEFAHIASLTKEETVAALRIKLVEEAFEVRDATKEQLKGELADVLEVVEALTRAAGLTQEEVEVVRRQKAKKRGKFEQGVVLIETASGGPTPAKNSLLESSRNEPHRVLHSEKAPPLERFRAGPADSRDTPSFVEFVQNGSVSLTHPEWTMEAPRHTPLPLNTPVSYLTWSIDGQRNGATLKLRVKIRLGRTQMELPFQTDGSDEED